MIRDMAKDIWMGCAVLGMIALPCIALRWAWEHGWHWPTEIVLASVAIVIVGVIGSKFRGA